MNYLSDISAAQTAIDTFLVQHARDLPADAVSALLAASAHVSPVDKIVNFSEIIYALGGRATAEAMTAAAQTVEFATRFSWHGLGAGGRGVGILAAFQRDLGEAAPAGGWPDKANDPAPRADVGIAVAPIAPVPSPA